MKIVNETLEAMMTTHLHPGIDIRNTFHHYSWQNCREQNLILNHASFVKYSIRNKVCLFISIQKRVARWAAVYQVDNLKLKMIRLN